MDINGVASYLVSNYDFEISPCQMPYDEWEYNKMNLFIMVKRKMLWLFRLLVKFFPIKRLQERPDGSVWLNKSLLDGLCEIELIDTEFDIDKDSKINVRIMYSDINMNVQIVDNYEETIEKLFYLIPELRILVRQKRLESLTEEVH